MKNRLFFFFAAFMIICACTDYHEEAVAPSRLSVSVSTLSFLEEASTQSVTVRSGEQWKVSSTPVWIDIESIDNRLAYSYEWPVTFSSQANNGYNREGIIVFGTSRESVSIPVEQRGKKGAYVAVESVAINPSTVSITKGDTKALTAIIQPTNASEQTVQWSSSNTSVATISSDGLVTAIEVGTATITVTTDDGGKKATCAVTVNPVAVSGVSLDKTSIALTVGENETLVATVTPSNAANKNVTWSSSGTDVATVSQTGRVDAVAEGTALITVTTEDGNKTASCVVTVKAKFIPVTGIILNKTSLTMTEGEVLELAATVTPSNASDQSVSWISSNTAIVTVSSAGVVTAKSVGSATITVKTTDGAKTATCTVTVKAKTVAVTGVSLDKTSITLTEGDTQTLVATIIPSNASNKSVTWSSSNTTVATVSSSGVVTAKSAGSATITVTTNDGGKKATCSVTVKEKTVSVTGISLDKTTLSMTEGDTYSLTATVTPSNATNKSVTWSSSSTSVATVSSSGVVTAKTAGSATITVTTVDGGKTATCSVTVQAKTIAVTGVSLNKTSLTLSIGNTQTLIATVTPSNATDKSVSWSSSNTSIATVSSSGVVTAKAAGSATITVTTNDGAKHATCIVTVKSPGNTEPIDDDGNESGWD